MDILAILLIGIASLLLLSIIWGTWRSGISPMPSSYKATKAIFALIPKGMSHGKIYELGAGWGGLAIALAARYPSCEIIGYESSLVPYLFCRLRLLLKPHTNMRIYYEDFFKSNLSDAKGIICYLYPGAMTKLKDKFERELPQNCWVISNTFAVPGWTPHQVCEIDDLFHSKVYFYRFNRLPSRKGQN